MGTAHRHGPSVLPVVVRRVVAGQGALAPSDAAVDEFEAAGGGGADDSCVEVDEVGVVHRVALGAGDAVGVVADAARGFEVYDVALVGAEGFVRQDAGSRVAGIAQGIGLGGFGGAVEGVVAGDEEGAEVGAVGAVGAGAAGLFAL